MFFRFCVVLLIAQSAWIALSGIYSMAFDENYHLAIIGKYSEKILPFWSSQPSEPATYGAITRDPSYMYHYLMSFLYRVIKPILATEYSQVIFLRFVNILLFVVSIIIVRKVLMNTKVSKKIANSILALLIVTPVSSFLAAQINYDNLLFLVVVITLLVAQKLIDKIKRDKLDLMLMGLLMILLLFGSLVKYSYLPIAFSVMIFIAFKLYRQLGSFKGYKITRAVKRNGPLNRLLIVLMVGSITILGGLFIERYGYNLVKYTTPTPECNQVLGIDRCMDYSPWRRNYLVRQSKLRGELRKSSPNPVYYATSIWLKIITNQMFYAINGQTNNFKTGQPLKTTRYLSVAFMLLGSLLFVFNFKKLVSQYRLKLLIATTLVYIGALFMQNYIDYLHLGYQVAIQSRYLIPVLPFIYLAIFLGLISGFRQLSVPRSFVLTIALMFLITQGGGAGIYIIRSDQSWYWPRDSVITANDYARKLLNKITVGD